MLLKLLLQIVIFISLLIPISVKAETTEFIKRAILTSAIENREPVDALTEVLPNTGKVYFFTEILNKANTHVTHRWLLNGKLEVEVVLKVGSDRWRTYSSKNLAPEFHTGTWQVEVIDEKNNLLASTTFTY